jgi:hypothetical protein
MHDANRRYWNEAAGWWKRLEEEGGLWQRFASEPGIAFTGGALRLGGTHPEANPRESRRGLEILAGALVLAGDRRQPPGLEGESQGSTAGMALYGFAEAHVSRVRDEVMDARECNG